MELRTDGIYMPMDYSDFIGPCLDRLCWNPQSALLQSDPQEGKLLPIPFSGRELAAFLLCPVAYEFLERFGNAGELDEQALMDCFGGVRDGICKRAIQDAYSHLERALLEAGPRKTELFDVADSLSNQYEGQRDIARVGLGIASVSGHGLSGAVYTKRINEANEAVNDLKSQVTAARKQAEADELDWLHRMVLALFDQTNGGRDDAATSTEGYPLVGSTNNAPACDFAMLASREQLIEAFGRFTGMDVTWFKNLKDIPALLAARKVAGQGGRGHIAEPLFCPFEVMQWLANSKRRKGRKLGAEKAWELLEKNFPRVYNARSVGDPRDCD